MKPLSKNVYVNKFANIANKNYNTYHSAIKMNPFDVKTSKHLETMIKTLNLKFMTQK